MEQTLRGRETYTSRVHEGPAGAHWPVQVHIQGSHLATALGQGHGEVQNGGSSTTTMGQAKLKAAAPKPASPQAVQQAKNASTLSAVSIPCCLATGRPTPTTDYFVMDRRLHSMVASSGLR